LLAHPGAVLHGHFALLSGLHTDRFLACSHIAKDSRALGKIADWLIPCLAPQAPTTPRRSWLLDPLGHPVDHPAARSIVSIDAGCAHDAARSADRG
jgi:hypothetical protein